MAAALPLVKVPALERLSQLATVNINQTSSGYHGNNYTVFGEGEEVVFKLNEIVPDTFFRGRAGRAFKFNGVDSAGTKVFSFCRPAGKFFISNKVKVFINEVLVSMINIPQTFLTPIFNINNALENPVLRLKGHIFGYFFQLQAINKTAIGAIQKKDRGWKKEWSSFKDNYVINFPANLAVPYKLAVIVACVYIDFRFHEGKQ